MIRIGIIGSGGMGRHHAATFARMEGVQLVGVSSRNAITGRQLAQDYGIRFASDVEELFSEVDAVVIATHNDSHGTLAALALENGKHVFLEYPLARSIEEGEHLLALAESQGLILRTTHPEPVSATHQGLKRRVAELGSLLIAHFIRLTPGRGSRPEVLFNLRVSGPPALFFIYHIYPVVDLFGSVSWVEGSALYEGITADERYERFVNTVTVGFRRGGMGIWTWAGGIEIQAAEESRRYILTGGTLYPEADGWKCSTCSGVSLVPPHDLLFPSLPELWLKEIRTGDLRAALADARVALDAIRISLCAERAMNEGTRVIL